tara:strand:+ start:185 stop:331 length:147 start_codon:yes stop_codon:yes gene_type:complete
MEKYVVTMIIETEDGRPSNWDWGDLLEHNVSHVSHVMSHLLYREYLDE